MKKGLLFIVVAVVVLFFSIFVITTTRVVLERWLYSCQSSAVISKVQSHGLPLPIAYSINAKLFQYPDAKCRIFYFHGRGRTLNYNYYMLGSLHHGTRCSIMAFEYPACDFDYFTDTDEGPDVLLQRARVILSIASKQDFFMCSSMGCSILLTALSGTTTMGAAGCILENPPTSLSEVAAFHTGIPSFFIRHLIGANNDWRVDDIPCDKVLLFTSEKDEIVPSSMGYQLAQHFSNNSGKKHIILDGANHGDAPSHPLYQVSIKEFVKG